MSKCPTCDRDNFKSKRGMKLHHSMVHGKSIAMSTVECDNCGDCFTEEDNKVEKYDKHFCSNICQGEHKSKTQTSEIQCDNCKSLFKIKNNRINKEENFCSRSCSGEYRTKQSTSTVECDECDALFTIRNCKMEKHDLHFCSNSCNSNYFTEENHPNWTGGFNKHYGSTWRRKREIVLELDNHKCRLCNGETNRLNIHHIIPKRKFDNVNDAHYKENLVTLCHDCHPQIESLEKDEQIERLNVPRLEIEV